MKSSIVQKVKIILTLVLIAIGTLMILRPWYDAWRFDRMQREIMRQWQSSAPYVSIENNDAVFAWTTSSTALGGFDSNAVWEEDINPEIDLQRLAGIVEGIISIERINMTAPILSEYSVENLNISICSVIRGNNMGRPGNYVLAGHNSRIRGRHFNRLFELSPGDIITVENRYSLYTYEVTDVFTVTPFDVWVMSNDGDRKLITLITCDYRTNPMGRFIVRGELVP